MRWVITVLVSCAVAAEAQQTGQNKPPGGNDPVTFTSTSQLVVETVRVTDKKGNPLQGLTARDFTVTEDGATQEIRIFEYQKLTETPAAPPATQTEPEKIHLVDRLTSVQMAPETSGTIRYKDRRLLALYFDMTAMPPLDQLRALDAAQKFVRTQMTAADLIAVMSYSGESVRVLQDFTEDRDRLLSVIEKLVVGEGQGLDEATNDASTSDTGAAFGQDDTEFNIFNTDRQMSALQTAVQMLGQLSEKKSLIYFASGLRLNGLDNQAQLHATVNAAIRAGVAFWPIDARGLVAQAPLGDATKGSPGGVGMYSGASALAATTNFQKSQDTLYALAADTGGKAFLDHNDLAKGIVEAEQAISSYYIIGYYTTNTSQDGKFRRIKISLGGNLSASLDYRQGYYAGKQFASFAAADKERQLEEALMLPDPITELTIAMEIDYFQLTQAEYFVPVTVKIPGRELALAKRGGAQRTRMDFIGEIKDDYGTTLTNVRDKVDIKLSDVAAIDLAKRPIEYNTGFTLLPGKYTMKLLARDAETGRIGTYQTTFVIPNLNKDVKRIPISSVVLSSQRVDLKDALYNAPKGKVNREAADPLVGGGQRLIPSVTRVFRRSREMYVYLQAYPQKAPNIQPLVAFVTFYRGEKKAFQTQPIKLSDALNNRMGTVPIRFDIPLNNLAAGEYDCQVTVLDPIGQKATFWQAGVVLVQ
jgi:VWFA-related protein